MNKQPPTAWHFPFLIGKLSLVKIVGLDDQEYHWLGHLQLFFQLALATFSLTTKCWASDLYLRIPSFSKQKRYFSLSFVRYRLLESRRRRSFSWFWRIENGD